MLQASLNIDKQEVLDRWKQYFADLMKTDKKIADRTQEESESYVYWTVHHCDSCRIRDQLDITCYFISLLMCSTCFGH